MSESEEPKKPGRRGRRKKPDPDGAPVATPSSEATASGEAPVATPSSEATASNASEEDVTTDAVPDSETAAPDAEPEAPEPEADADADADDEDDEPEAEAPAKRRRLRRGAGKTEEPPAAPAPTRRRSRRDPSLPPPVVRAQAKYVRSSARKARLVCDHIRGKSVEDARAILAHTPRAIAQDWSKLLESAVANAEHNHELVGEDLYVKAVHADEGPTIKRFRPRAMGRATKILKRTSHLTILLTPKD
jgi:ribosomal protein L22